MNINICLLRYDKHVQFHVQLQGFLDIEDVSVDITAS